MFNLISPVLDFFKNPTIVICVVLAVWDYIWKGVSCYKAGQKSQGGRFMCLFIFNTCGILPIIYLITNRNK